MPSPPSDYLLHEVIGRGSSGTVFRGRHRSLDRTVALKLIPTTGLDAEQRLAIVAEGRSLARLDHPRIVRVFDVAVSPDAIWLITEYVPGRSLQQILDSGSLPDPAISLSWSVQLADALVALHRAGLVHGDLKPANVIATGHATCRLIDFGTAGPRGIGTAGGTPAYMSPEHVTGRPITHKSDVYSLGLMLHQLLTGRHPLESVSGNPVEMPATQRTGAPSYPGNDNPAISRRMRRIIAATLRRRPAARPSPMRLRRQLAAELG